MHTDPLITLAWLIPLFPLIAFLVNGFIGAKLPKAVSGGLATIAVFASFAVAVSIFFGLLAEPSAARIHVVRGASWFAVAADPATALKQLAVNFELLIDPLSILMILIITGVGGLIHLYSTAYMAADKNYSRFFTYLNLFIFFMLLLVMANNLLLLFVGWEGVGLCSYLLIGFFNEKKSAGDAAKKAMIVNRIGDVGVLIGMFMIFQYFGTLDFRTGASQITGILDRTDLNTMFSGAVIATILLMLFLGATGKSAQLPLYVWLPDAMEGPTPVSALIHAATMVTAGVYMVSRLHSLFQLSDLAMTTIAVIGISTALFAATIGLMQNDIKRVLAYSTVSQLGYMFAACGAGVFAAGMYHVMTHAFFKACLFLGSGSVIHSIEHAMHSSHGTAPGETEGHEAADGHGAAIHSEPGHSVAVGGPDPNDPQDMRNMGGLSGKIKITAVTMIAATLAIAGIVPFAGYWSKGEILWSLWQVKGGESNAHFIFWGIGALTALITAFYMSRLIVKTFFGPARSEAAKGAKESSLAITIPLVILAALSFTTGWAFVPFEKFAEFLAPSVSTPGYLPPIQNPGFKGTLEVGLLIGIALSIFACLAAYAGGKRAQLQSPEVRTNHAIFSPGWIYWVLLNKYFVDEAYNYWFVKEGKKLASFVYTVLDEQVIDGALVNGVVRLTQSGAGFLRRAQNGFVRSYAFSMVLGIVIVLIGCLAGLGHGR